MRALRRLAHPLTIAGCLTALLLCVGGCDHPVLIVEKEKSIERFGLDSLAISKIALDGSYLFACAGTQGLWRRSITPLSAWESLGFTDPGQASGNKVGLSDVDAKGKDILVLYSIGDADTVNDSIAGIWRSTDFGNSFRRAESGIIDENGVASSHYILSIERSPGDPSIGLASSFEQAFRTTDGGSSWAPIKLIGVPGLQGDIRWDPHRPLDVWIYGETGAFSNFIAHFTQAGLHWMPTNYFPPEIYYGPSEAFPFQELVFDAGDTNTLYLVNRTLLKSTDGGRSWTFPMTSRAPYFYVLAPHPSLEHVLFLSSGALIYESTDGGLSVASVGTVPGGVVTSMAGDPASNVLYISTSRGVCKYSL
jgi:hypothetical protein